VAFFMALIFVLSSLTCFENKGVSFKGL